MSTLSPYTLSTLEVVGQNLASCTHGAGYAAQIYDKLAFDAYVPSDTDIVIFFDSDVMLLRPLLLADVLEPRSGRPLHALRL